MERVALTEEEALQTTSLKESTEEQSKNSHEVVNAETKLQTKMTRFGRRTTLQMEVTLAFNSPHGI